jgi:hypothetical protein
MIGLLKPIDRTEEKELSAQNKILAREALLCFDPASLGTQTEEKCSSQETVARLFVQYIQVYDERPA